MAAASAALLFMNGLGAICGPLVTGWIMEQAGPSGFFLFIGILYGAMAAYAGWRMTRRAAPAVADTGSFATVAPTASSVAVGAVMEVVTEAQEAQQAAE